MQWIKITERLPEKNKVVIVKRNDGSVKWETNVDGTWLYRQDIFCWLDETPPPVEVEQGAKEYADKFFPIKDYAAYESDYDYRTQCARNRQLQEHFLAGATHRAENQGVDSRIEELLEYIDIVINNYKKQVGENYVEPYFFPGLKERIKELSPLLPSNFITRLREANPYHVAYEKGVTSKNLPYRIWIECCDTAEQLLNQKDK